MENCTGSERCTVCTESQYSEPLRRCPEDEPGTIVVCVYVAADLAPYAHGDDESVAANAALMLNYRQGSRAIIASLKRRIDAMDSKARFRPPSG